MIFTPKGQPHPQERKRRSAWGVNFGPWCLSRFNPFEKVRHVNVGILALAAWHSGPPTEQKIPGSNPARVQAF
jgi:hypothetical protein